VRFAVRFRTACKARAIRVRSRWIQGQGSYYWGERDVAG
jgi:hypothetical protein